MSTAQEAFFKNVFIDQFGALQQTTNYQTKVQQLRDLVDAAERPIGDLSIADEPIRATVIRVLPAIVAVGAMTLIGMIGRKKEVK